MRCLVIAVSVDENLIKARQLSTNDFCINSYLTSFSDPSSVMVSLPNKSRASRKFKLTRQFPPRIRLEAHFRPDRLGRGLGILRPNRPNGQSIAPCNLAPWTGIDAVSPFIRHGAQPPNHSYRLLYPSLPQSSSLQAIPSDKTAKERQTYSLSIKSWRYESIYLSSSPPRTDHSPDHATILVPSFTYCQPSTRTRPTS